MKNVVLPLAALAAVLIVCPKIPLAQTTQQQGGGGGSSSAQQEGKSGGGGMQSDRKSSQSGRAAGGGQMKQERPGASVSGEAGRAKGATREGRADQGRNKQVSVHRDTRRDGNRRAGRTDINIYGSADRRRVRGADVRIQDRRTGAGSGRAYGYSSAGSGGCEALLQRYRACRRSD